jgi:hypothetical protein
MKRLTHLLALSCVAMLACVATSASAIEVEAVSGEPWGVGRITVQGADVGSIDERSVLISDRDQRILYPVVTPGVIGRLFERVLGSPVDRPSEAVTVMFLFHGDEPLHVTLQTPKTTELTVTPRPAEGGGRRGRPDNRLLMRWWREYSAVSRTRVQEDDHPPIVETYMQSMLSQRLGLEQPLLDRVGQQQTATSTSQRSLELLLGLERLRLEIMRETLSGRSNFTEQASEPLPRELTWAPLTVPPVPKDVPVERLAQHVPEECFYLRFGRFTNYLWFTDLLEDYGNDIGSMVTMRSYVPPMSARSQQQLGLERNDLARVFGPQVISDVALIGRDTYVQQGAAIGILFQAKSTELLADDIQKQRRKAMEKEKNNGATEQKVQIAGHEVSFVYTPDNRLRSFWAADGDFHLVTTSRAMVERFFEAGEGRGALADSAEFRNARTVMPIDRDDTIFIYFSSAFFQGLLSPQYQIETYRRLQSLTDLEILQMAKWAARAEGLRDESNDGLIASGLLPPRFGQRPDGSEAIISRTELRDSRRGARGVFTPIADMEIRGITATERDRYNSMASMYEQQWKQMDPLMVGIKRFALEEDRLERVVIDGNIEPLNEGKFGWILSMIGPPSRQMVLPAENDIVSVQAIIRGGVLSPNVPPHHMFLGIQDLPPLAELQGGGGLLKTMRLIRSVPGYIGAWPQPGFLEMLPFGLGGGPPDEYGFSRLPLGIWRRQGSGYSVLSYDPNLLAEVTPQLRVVESDNEAQIRVSVGDLSQAKFRNWVNQLYYDRALQGSAGNVRFMYALNQQLHIPMEDAPEMAERLVDGQLHDPLGGDYKLVETEDGGLFWRSTEFPERGGRMPETFQAPILDWFRGLDAHVTKYGDRMVARLEVDMLRKEREQPKFEIPSLPLFNLFGNGTKAFQPKKDQPEELPPPLPEAPAPRDSNEPLPRPREF